MVAQAGGGSIPSLISVGCVRGDRRWTQKKHMAENQFDRGLRIIQLRMECIASIDQGTQSTRCCIFNKQAEVVASYQVEFEQHTPHAG